MAEKFLQLKLLHQTVTCRDKETVRVVCHQVFKSHCLRSRTCVSRGLVLDAPKSSKFKFGDKVTFVTTTSEKFQKDRASSISILVDSEFDFFPFPLHSHNLIKAHLLIEILCWSLLITPSDFFAGICPDQDLGTWVS